MSLWIKNVEIAIDTKDKMPHLNDLIKEQFELEELTYLDVIR